MNINYLEQIMSDCNRFNKFSFDQLHALLVSRITAYGLRILNDKFVIENIVQDAFLKLWQFRQTITSSNHAEGFLKQSVKWGCHTYFSNRTSRFHRYMVKLDEYNNCETISETACSDAVDADNEDDRTEHRVQQALEAVTHLFYGRDQEVMELYFIKGYSQTRIARRYGWSVPIVTAIIDKGKLRLKAVIVKGPISSTSLRKPSNLSLGDFDTIDGLNAEQNAIYQLRMIGKYNFDQIASFLSLSIPFVQREYVTAWKIAACQNKKKRQMLSDLLNA